MQVLTNLLELDKVLPPRTVMLIIEVVGNLVELADRLKCESALIAFEKEGCLDAIEFLATSNNDEIRAIAEELIRIYSDQSDAAAIET